MGQHRYRPALWRKAGDTLPMNNAEIDDLVAFLGTLTDGFLNPTACKINAALGNQ